MQQVLHRSHRVVKEEIYLMKQFDKGFLVGAATAAHQVEGNNIHSDFWLMENLPHSMFTEPSLDAVDHYHRYEEDIRLLAEAGLNAYRFSIEWARIEPEQGKFDELEIAHYRKVLECCHEHGVTPIVTMHHFSSPRWLISQGGWESPEVVDRFKKYCVYVVGKLGELMGYVCTINEANMGLQIAAISRDYMRQMGINLQVGMNFEPPKERVAQMLEIAQAFGIADPRNLHTFLDVRTKDGDVLTMQAHEAARDAMKAACPHLRVGITLSLHDLQPLPGGELLAESEWNDELLHYLPYIKNDDFIGVQNYTRKLIDDKGAQPVPNGIERTQMGYEFYPQALGNVIRKVAKVLPIPIIVTENGIGTAEDTRRVAFIEQATAGVMDCIAEGIPVKGYLHWTLLDNFEWHKGFSMTFGLIAVDRATQTRKPKESLYYLGKMAQ